MSYTRLDGPNVVDVDCVRLQPRRTCDAENSLMFNVGLGLLLHRPRRICVEKKSVIYLTLTTIHTGRHAADTLFAATVAGAVAANAADAVITQTPLSM